MRKKYLVLIAILIINVSIANRLTIAQEVSPSPTIEVSAVEEQQIKDLKEKIATKVAEINEKNTKAISGYITNIKDKIINIKNDDGDYEVKTDETITKYFQISGNRKNEIKLQNLKKGNYIIANGLINDKKIDTNFIYVDEAYSVKSGKVSEINSDDYYIKVVTLEKENYILDIESYTKKQMLNIKTLQLETIGFSKVKEGDTIHFVIKKTSEKNENNRFSAQKILIIPQEFFIK